MVKKWIGIKEIVGKATIDLIETEEDGYLYYSAPKGKRLLLSVLTVAPMKVSYEIKDFGIAINGRKDGIVRRGFLVGQSRIITDDDEPVLILAEEEGIGAEEIMSRIKEERRKARYRIQGRMFP
ncbi:MAG: hypothetical protein JSV09_09785 [Thermoplasmata archaeon]|nr:MAG: hypothetical protein JSV09_09785 [Thermoplasmata archaeon]